MQADHAGYNNQIHSKSGPEIASSTQISTEVTRSLLSLRIRSSSLKLLYIGKINFLLKSNNIDLISLLFISFIDKKICV